MKENKAARSASLLILFCAALVNCQSYEERALIYGTAIFLTYLIVIGIIYLAEKFHDMKWFLVFRKKLRPLTIVFTVLGFLTSMVSLYVFSRGEEHARLFLYESVILSITSFCLLKWSFTEDKAKQKFLVKMISLGISVAIAIAFLIFKGEDFLK